MSTHCDGGVYTFSCDACPEAYGVSDDDPDIDNAVFEEVWMAAKSNGWVAFKVSERGKDEWKHYCAACAKEN